MKVLLLPLLLLVTSSPHGISGSIGGEEESVVLRIRYPLQFTENAGQWHAGLKYAALSPAQSIAFSCEGFTVSTDRGILNRTLRLPVEAPDAAADFSAREKWSLFFVKPSARMQIEAGEKTPTRSNFYQGNDSSVWRTGVSNYRGLRFRNVWDGIDAEYRENDGMLQQTFVLHPGADARRLKLKTDADPAAIPVSVRAYQIEGGDSITLPASVHSAEDGTLTFDVARGNISAPTWLVTEFRTYFGGSSHDYGGKLVVNDSGQFYLSGTTLSTDLPLKNAVQPVNTGGMYDTFLAKFASDGRTLLFSTYYGGSGSEFSGGSGGPGLGRQSNVLLGKNNSIYIGGQSASTDLPVTTDALQKTFDSRFIRSNYLSRYDVDGGLLYSSYLHPTEYLGGDNLLALALMPDSGIVIAGETHSPFDFMPPGGFQQKHIRTLDGNLTSFVMRLSAECDTVLYGTYYGSYTTPTYRWDDKIAVDSKGNIILYGSLTANGLPVKNPISDSLRGLSDMFVAKFDPTLSMLHFGTYLGGNGDDWAGSWGHNLGGGVMNCISNNMHGYGWGQGNECMAIDANDNIIVTGSSTSLDFPLRNPLKPMLDTSAYPYTVSPRYSVPDLVVTKLSPSGQLLFSTYLGGSGSDVPMSLFLDNCGSIVLTGHTCSPDYPLTGRTDTAHTGLFVTVIDKSGVSLRLSTILEPMWSGMVGTTYERSWASTTYAGGFFYLTRSTYRDTLTFNAFQPAKAGADDVVIERRSFPLPDIASLRCDLSLPDTILVNAALGTATPESFDLTLDLTNINAGSSAARIEGDLVLPTGIVLDPPEQRLHFSLDSLVVPPGGHARVVWHARISMNGWNDTIIHASVTVTYANEDSPVLCSRMTLRCTAATVVMVYRMTPLGMQCSLTGPGNVHINAQRNAYLPDPFDVSFTLKNGSIVAARNLTAKLRIPPQDGVEIAPKSDSVRWISFLDIDSTVLLSWKLHAALRTHVRTLRVTVTVVDTFGTEFSTCGVLIDIPPLKEFHCDSNNTQTVTYDWKTRRFGPDPFPVMLSLNNHLDAPLTGLRVRLDTSAAPNLRLGPGEVALRTLASLWKTKSVILVWNLRVRPGADTNSLEQLRFMIDCNEYASQTVCIANVILSVPPPLLEGEASCTVLSPDSLQRALNDTSYTPAHTMVTARIVNIGTGPLAAGSSELQYSPLSAFSPLDSMRRSTRALTPGAIDTLAWRFTPITSRFDRAVHFTLTLTDADGKPASSCEKMMFVPGLLNPLACALSSPDSIRYALATDRFTPDPFAVSLTLRNVLDTAEARIETEVDLSSAPHLALVRR